MIQFSELRISPDKRHLYIGCVVENFDIYNNVYIKYVYVDYYKNRQASGEPSEHAICVYDNTQDNPNVKSAYVDLNVNMLEGHDFGTDTFDGGLFYVYVACDVNGPSLATADCGWDSMYTTGIAADWQKVYAQGMMHISDATGSCNVKDGFIDFILRWDALQLAMETCDYEYVDALWDELFEYMPSQDSGCGCKR